MTISNSELLAAVAAALDLPPDRREAFLLSRFANDESVLATALALIEASVREDSFMQPPLSSGAERLAPETVVGAYRVIRHVASGGMGDVYEAEQSEPRRRVALKLMRIRPGSIDALRRFRYEVDVLGRMRHPAIAAVHDAGIQRVGHFDVPYFAMEYIDGARTLTRYVREESLGIRARLELFVHVGEGVRYGHQLGVIHRDLKPANLLVGVDGRPRIIDYGVARSIGANSLEATLTIDGQLIGTVGYMSPEQIERPMDVDTRTDVYALGVVLYELLADRPPFDLDGVSLASALRIVAEGVPTPLRRVAPSVPSDLAAIVTRAMARDPAARYPSVGAMLDDMHRFGRREPVQAVGPNRRYLFQQFVRRHRVPCVAAGLIALSLLAGGAATYREFLRANENAALAMQRERIAQDRLEEFGFLRNVIQLADARELARELHPRTPARAAAMREWLARYSDPLSARREEVERASAHLRESAATPLSDAAQLESRAAHPRAAELRELEAKLADWRLRQAVSTGQAHVPVAEVVDPSRDAVDLYHAAWPLVDPWRLTWNRAPEGLQLMRRALERVDGGDPSLVRSFALDGLAWACLRCGLHEEAERHATAALAAAPPGLVQQQTASTSQIRSSLKSWANERETKIAALDEQVRALSKLIAADSSFAFADDRDRFLHEVMSQWLTDLDTFNGPEGEVRSIETRLAEAESIERLSIDDHAAEWEATIAGIEAEPRYRGLRLTPQVGLVPIGQDPASGLFEFVHLASGVPGTPLPRRDERTGRLAVESDCGIVFVLVPGGALLTGAQPHDPAGPNFDRLALGREEIRPTMVGPMLLGKFELSRAQWARLWDGPERMRWPSAYPVGWRDPQSSETLTALHPVDLVSWTECEALLSRHGLRMPTGAEWEYCCRAGTATPWSSGPDASNLAEHANLRDRRSVGLPWGPPEPWNDGWVCVAPIGSFRPNPFGFHDMHGNVWEWCDELWAHTAQTIGRMRRGGSFFDGAAEARVTNRQPTAPDLRQDHMGVRVARTIDRP